MSALAPRPADDIALELDRVSVTLGGTPVLDAVSLRVSRGEFISILGPSGAGKSTLLRILTGAVTPDTGVIRADGGLHEPGQQPFAFMPQRDALMEWRRVIDNVTLGLEVQGVRRAQARERALPLMGAFGLDGFEHHYPAQLSGGMRQRAALLRTVVQSRPIQLLDEPFGALDALTRTKMQCWFESRWQAARWTTVLVTHDVREAVALSDRIYVLSPRPARVVAEFPVPIPRPRASRTSCPESARLEAEILDTLLIDHGELP